MGNKNSQYVREREVTNDSNSSDLPFNFNLYKNNFFISTNHIHKSGDEAIYLTKVIRKSNNFNCNRRHQVNFLRELQKKLASCLHSGILINVGESKRHTYYVRPYYFNTLSERMSSKPPLSNLQKKWITYQLLRYLEEAQKNKIFHGDIKPNNVMLSSCNWVYIVDHSACYKPVNASAIDSKKFKYFFKTNNPNDCYVAPERFCENTELDFEIEMDVFSVGCVIAKLWSESSVDLFEYDSKTMLIKRDANNLKNLVQDEFVRNFVLKMTAYDCEKRISGSQCLNYARGVWLPLYFDVLYDFLSKIISFCPKKKILAIYRAIPNLSKHLIDLKPIVLRSEHMPLDDSKQSNQPVKAKSAKFLNTSLPSSMCDTVPKRLLNFVNASSVDNVKLHSETQRPSFGIGKRTSSCLNVSWSRMGGICESCAHWVYPNSVNANAIYNSRELKIVARPLEASRAVQGGFELIVDVLCSTVFSSLSVDVKLKLLDCLVVANGFVGSDMIIYVIVLYLVNLIDVNGNSDRELSVIVRSRLIQTLVIAISSAKNTYSYEDFKLFVNVVLPSISGYLKCETEDLVLYTCASLMSKLVEAAENFFFCTKFFEPELSKRSQVELCIFNIDGLKDYFRELIVDGLLNRNVVSIGVKTTFLRALSSLCTFFGSDTTNSVIVPFIFSFVNDSQRELVCEVFDCIARIGQSIESTVIIDQYVYSIVSLIIHSRSEYVTLSVLRCLLSLIRAKVLSEITMLHMVESVSPLVLHPNPSIRSHANCIFTAAFLSMNSHNSDERLLRILTPFLQHTPQHGKKLKSKHLLRILPNISRQLYNSILNDSKFASLLKHENSLRDLNEATALNYKFSKSDFHAMKLMRKHLCSVIENSKRHSTKSKFGAGRSKLDWGSDYYEFTSLKISCAPIPNERKNKDASLTHST